MPTIDLTTLTAQEMVREAIKRVLDQGTDRVRVAIDATVAGGQEILIGHINDSIKIGNGSTTLPQFVDINLLREMKVDYATGGSYLAAIYGTVSTSALQVTGNALLSAGHTFLGLGFTLQGFGNSLLSSINSTVSTSALQGAGHTFLGLGFSLQGFGNSLLSSIDSKVSTSALQITGHGLLSSGLTLSAIGITVAAEGITLLGLGNSLLTSLNAKLIQGTAGGPVAVPRNAASVTALAANASRKGALFFNDSNANCFLAYGATATTTLFTTRLSSQSEHILDRLDYTGAVSAIWATAGAGTLMVTEVI